MPGAGTRLPGTYETYEFSVGPNNGNGSMTVKVEWDIDQNDWDLFVYGPDGSQVASSTTSSGNESVVIDGETFSVERAITIEALLYRDGRTIDEVLPMLLRRWPDLRVETSRRLMSRLLTLPAALGGNRGS